MLAQYGPILYIMLFSVLAIYGCYRFIDWFEREQPVEKWKAGQRPRLMWVNSGK